MTAGSESGEDLVGNLLLTVLIAACVASLDHGWEPAVQSDFRPLRPGDVIVVELVPAGVDRHGSDPDIGVATLLTGERSAKRLFHQAHQVRVLRRRADEDERLP
jgi:hypothetical protein